MMWVRGNKSDYEKWAKESESDEWKWEKLLPLFKKCENYKEGNKDLRGKEGNIFPITPGKKSTLIYSMMKTLENVGLTKIVDDYNK